MTNISKDDQYIKTCQLFITSSLPVYRKPDIKKRKTRSLQRKPAFGYSSDVKGAKAKKKAAASNVLDQSNSAPVASMTLSGYAHS